MRRGPPALLSGGILLLAAGCLVNEVDLGGHGVDAGQADAASPAAAALQLRPTALQFSSAALGVPVVRAVELSNVGASRLRVYDVLLTSDADAQLDLPAATSTGRLPALPQDLAQAAAGGPVLRVDVRLRCERLGPVVGALLVRSDAPARPNVEVPVSAECVERRLEVTPAVLDFGAQALDLRASRKLRLHNPGPAPLSLLALAFVEPGSSPDFRVQTPPAGMTCDDGGRTCTGAQRLTAGEAVSVEVSYRPGDTGGDAARLAVHSDLPSREPEEVLLLGNGSAGTCERAVVRVRAPSAGQQGWLEYPPQADPLVVPAGTRVELEARGPAGAVPPGPGVRWRLAEHPYGHAGRFLPALGAAGVELTLDAAGTWIVELEVVDASSSDTCRAARLPLRAEATEALRVELAWDTPGDPDPLDAGFGAGADLDLHLLHPSGAWFEHPWDCHFAGPTPDWGRPLHSADDPLLHGDDLDGWGPEIVTLQEPVAGEVLRVGAHVYDPHGFGASSATLRVYLQGALRVELRRRALPDERALWDALLVEPGGGTVVPLDRLLRPGPEPPPKGPAVPR